MSARLWTDDDLILAWQCGREFEAARMAEAAEEFRLSDLLPVPVSYEQRVAERVALFERCAEQFAQRLGRPYVAHHGRERVAA